MYMKIFRMVTGT